MPRFEVLINRTVYESLTVFIEADTKEAAEEQADNDLAEAGINGDWPEFDFDGSDHTFEATPVEED